MPRRPPTNAVEPGNRLAVKHGAHAAVAPDRLGERAAAIYEQIAAAVPVKEAGALPPADEGVVQDLATTECRLEDVRAWLDKHGPLDRKGKPRSAANWERRLQSHALKLRKELGLTPQSRAKLGLNLARTVDLATAMSETDPQRRSQMLREAGLPPAGDGDVVDGED